MYSLHILHVELVESKRYPDSHSMQTEGVHSEHPVNFELHKEHFDVGLTKYPDSHCWQELLSEHCRQFGKAMWQAWQVCDAVR